MIYCKELNKEFESKEKMFSAIVENKTNIINLKKSAILKSHEKGQLSFQGMKTDTAKAFDFVKDGYVYPIINTSNYYDSHGDVHLPNLWNKSLKENKGNVLYVSDHSLKINDVISWANDVEVFVKDISWSDLGRSYEGNTHALIFEVDKSKIINQTAKQIIEEKREVQNSVRMQYVKIELAVNSESKQYKVEKKAWDENIDKVVNRADAESEGYMWLIKEAKIIKEGSMVLFGSNDATPIIYEPEKSTQAESKNEPSNDTHKNNLLLNLM